MFFMSRAVKTFKEKEKQEREAAMRVEMETRHAAESLMPSTAIELQQAVSQTKVTVSSEEANLQVLRFNLVLSMLEITLTT